MLTSNQKDITTQIDKILDNEQRVIILVAGNSRSGKSTLSNNLVNYYMNQGRLTQKIELDDWIISVDERNEVMNVYDRFNSKQIENDFIRLMAGETLVLEAYDARTRGRQRKQKKLELNENGVIIVEGVIALGLKTLLENSELSIFVEVPEDIRKKRMFEFYIEKGLDEVDINTLYNDRIEDEFNLVNETKINSSIIYQGDE